MDAFKQIGDNYLIFDGAMGTMLQDAGLEAGGLPEVYNIEHGEVVLDIHKKYVAAGCDVITTNTFQANELKLKDCGYSPEEIITAGVKLAKQSGARFVALDMGPLGQLMEPMGTLTFDDAYDMYKRQILAGAAAGADILLFETMSDLLEVKAGVLAAKENTDLPVFVTMTYQDDGRTFVGCEPRGAAVTLSGLGVDALGVNCSLGPAELKGIVEELSRYSRVPIMVQPNAGLPKIKDGRTVYDITTDEFEKYMSEIADMTGVRVLGGCCGTTPEFISAIKRVTADRKPSAPAPLKICAVTSGTKTVVLDDGVSVIGERINPTGKKKLKEKLRALDFDYIIGEAISQKQNGADILDVNCGLPEIDEPAVIARAVKEIQAAVDLPLQIDSSDPAAIESAIRKYNGKPIINSVNGKPESLAAILPIAKKYGAVVIGLCLDKNGIPETAEGRYKIAEYIVGEAAKYGLPKEDVIIDSLVLTASAQQAQVMETLNTIKLVKQRLGIKTVLGVSNVSFGLPARPLLNGVFLAAAFGAGLDAAIINPMSVDAMNSVNAFKVINNQDRDAENYTAIYSGYNTEREKLNTSAAPQNSEAGGDLKSLIIDGRKSEAESLTAKTLETEPPLSVIDDYFIPALDVVGDRYERGEIFLPQLIRSAETVKAGFELIKDKMSASSESGAGTSKGRIVIATVEGDIHDIGKNIVRMLLENYGYDVIDLGKDVPIQKVVDTVVENDIKLVGLSALMTTTVKSMKDTIAALRAAGSDAKVIVGGAVLNEEYVDFVGADYYAKDARASVKIANEFFGHA